MNKLKMLRKMLFALPLSEANFKVRRFEEGAEAQARLELVAKTVVSGYNTALETGLSPDLRINTSIIKNELVGFFNEGIGMGLYTLDLFSTRKDRFWHFIKGEGKRHEYMSYIGAGLASGVFFNRPFRKFLENADPTSGLLILNGLGFYYAYFYPSRTLRKLYIPRSVKKDPFFIDCYDNGIGRALWFYNGGQPEKIAETIELLPSERHGAVWAGVGLAATYVGGVSKSIIELLKQVAGQHAVRLGEGAVLATHTRDIAGNPHADDSAVQILTGRTSIECNIFAAWAKSQLERKRYIEGQHSLFVFLEKIRKWLTINPHEDSTSAEKLEEVVKRDYQD